MVRKGGDEKSFGEHSSPLFSPPISTHQIQLATYFLPYIKLPKTPIHYTFTLKMVTVMFAETLVNFQHSTRLTPESRSYTLNSSREKPEDNKNPKNFFPENVF
jgi:hypothetical protein